MRDGEEEDRVEEDISSSITRPHDLMSRPAACYLSQSWKLFPMELSDSLLPAAVTARTHVRCGAGRTLAMQQGQMPGRLPLLEPLQQRNCLYLRSHVGSLELQHASSTNKERVPGSDLKSDFHEILIQAVSNSGWFCHGTKPGPAFGQLRCSYPGQSSRLLEGPHKNKRRLSMQDSMGKDRLNFNSGDGLFGPQSQGEVVSPST